MKDVKQKPKYHELMKLGSMLRAPSSRSTVSCLFALRVSLTTRRSSIPNANIKTDSIIQSTTFPFLSQSTLNQPPSTLCCICMEILLADTKATRSCLICQLKLD